MKVMCKQYIKEIDKSFVSAKPSLSPRDRLKKHPRCVLLDYKMGKMYKGKLTKLHKLLYFSR